MISLKDYVKKRNGVALGHSNSLAKMLKRSLTARSFDLFWVYWNPIWNYYLNRYVYKSLNELTHQFIAILLTFVFSGFIHDLVGVFIYKKTILFFTLWFMTMGSVVAVFKHKKIKYASRSTAIICFINTSIVLTSFCFVKVLYILIKLLFF